jgi:hypothetical protein
MTYPELEGSDIGFSPQKFRFIPRWLHVIFSVDDVALEHAPLRVSSCPPDNHSTIAPTNVIAPQSVRLSWAGGTLSELQALSWGGGYLWPGTWLLTEGRSGISQTNNLKCWVLFPMRSLDFFNWSNPSSSTIALESTQPLKWVPEIFLGVRLGRRVSLTTSPPTVSRLSRENVGASTSNNPTGLHSLLQE